MLRSFSLVSKVLGIEDFAVGESGVTLTAGQMQAVEDALAARDKRNTDLADQLAALQTTPADTSTAVVADVTAETTVPEDEIQRFAATCNNSRSLFNKLP